jgi:hypothetical protein
MISNRQQHIPITELIGRLNRSTCTCGDGKLLRQAALWSCHAADQLINWQWRTG